MWYHMQLVQKFGQIFKNTQIRPKIQIKSLPKTAKFSQFGRKKAKFPTLAATMRCGCALLYQTCWVPLTTCKQFCWSYPKNNFTTNAQYLPHIKKRYGAGWQHLSRFFRFQRELVTFSCPVFTKVTFSTGIRCLSQQKNTVGGIVEMLLGCGKKRKE